MENEKVLEDMERKEESNESKRIRIWKIGKRIKKGLDMMGKEKVNKGGKIVERWKSKLLVGKNESERIKKVIERKKSGEGREDKEKEEIRKKREIEIWRRRKEIRKELKIGGKRILWRSIKRFGVRKIGMEVGSEKE